VGAAHFFFVLAIVIPGILVYFLLGLSAVAQSSGDPAAIQDRAISLQKDGRFEEAASEWRTLLALVPRSPEAHSNLAAALVRLGRVDEAVAEYREALALGDNPAIRFNLAIAYYKSFQFAPAEKELAALLVRQPGHRAARVLLADCYWQSGEVKKVIPLLEPLEEKNADDKAVAYLLGMSYLRSGQTLRGQLLVDRILRQGDSAEAHVMMGTAHQMAGEYPDARREYERAAVLNPEMPGVNALLGRTLMSMGDTTAAILAFRAELRHNPGDFQANLHLGVLFKQDQNNEEAMECFGRALAAKPGAAEVRYQIGALQLIIGDAPGARETLEGVVKEEPMFLEAHVSLATVYYRLKRKEDGDRQRALAQELSREIQAKEPGAKDDLGPAYRGEASPPAPPPPPETPPPGRP
jgi:tetratricopeptide (TPR) repeat protein